MTHYSFKIEPRTTSKPIAFSRRSVLKTALAASAAGTLSSLAGCAVSGNTMAKSLGHVVVVGAGFGGATAAKYIRLWSGNTIDVTVVERNATHVSCPMSNLVLGGSRKIDELTQSYDGLKAVGIKVVQGEVVSIDNTKKTVALKDGSALKYDRLIVAPGVDFLFEDIKGYDAAAQATVFHAWKAGAQTVALRKQLEAMPDGGTYAIAIPKAPYRCPPGPYERACQVASYFKANKPKSKVLILDGNEDVQSKKGLFMKAWNGEYKGIIEYRNNWEAKELNAATKTVTSDLGDVVKADVLNVIPPMRAGDIAKTANLITANKRWCEVDFVTMESKAAGAQGIHVLGDAIQIAPGMPKSAHMANQHGKTAAAAIVETMNGRTPQALMMTNTCYSYIDDKRVVHVASVHQYDADKKTMVTVAGSGGLSTEANELEGVYAWGWAQTIWADSFA